MDKTLIESTVNDLLENIKPNLVFVRDVSFDNFEEAFDDVDKVIFTFMLSDLNLSLGCIIDFIYKYNRDNYGGFDRFLDYVDANGIVDENVMSMEMLLWKLKEFMDINFSEMIAMDNKELMELFVEIKDVFICLFDYLLQLDLDSIISVVA